MVLAAIADALFPVACPGCGSQPSQRMPVCDECLALVRPAPTHPPPVGIESWAAPFAYEGVVRELIARVKYRDERHALAWLAARAAATARARLEPPGVVTWAPTTRSHKRARGFDHAATLARRVAAHLGVPCRTMLVRIGDAAQTGRPARERRDGPRFELLRGDRTQVARVLLVDDVATTGATLRAAARALHEAATTRAVDAVTIARTPLPT